MQNSVNNICPRFGRKIYSHNDDDNPAADNDAAFTQRLLQFVNRKKIKLFFTIFFN